MKICYGQFNSNNLACNDCQQKDECLKMPSCFKKFDKKSQFCNDVCRHGSDCLGENVEVDGVERLEAFEKQGKVSFKERVELSMPIIGQRARERGDDTTEANFEPYTPPVYKPKRRQRRLPTMSKDLQERMGYIHN